MEGYKRHSERAFRAVLLGRIAVQDVVSALVRSKHSGSSFVQGNAARIRAQARPHRRDDRAYVRRPRCGRLCRGRNRHEHVSGDDDQDGHRNARHGHAADCLVGGVRACRLPHVVGDDGRHDGAERRTNGADPCRHRPQTGESWPAIGGDRPVCRGLSRHMGDLQSHRHDVAMGTPIPGHSHRNDGDRQPDHRRSGSHRRRPLSAHAIQICLSHALPKPFDLHPSPLASWQGWRLPDGHRARRLLPWVLLVPDDSPVLRGDHEPHLDLPASRYMSGSRSLPPVTAG